MLQVHEEFCKRCVGALNQTEKKKLINSSGNDERDQHFIHIYTTAPHT